jgi:hypothetical protein
MVITVNMTVRKLSVDDDESSPKHYQIRQLCAKVAKKAANPQGTLEQHDLFMVCAGICF